MNRLIITTLLILFAATCQAAAVKQWYNNPDTTTVPDNGKLLMHNPTTVTDHTVTIKTLNKTLAPAQMKNYSSMTRAYIRADGAFVITR